jgi:hypothetical protein
MNCTIPYRRIWIRSAICWNLNFCSGLNLRWVTFLVAAARFGRVLILGSDSIFSLNPQQDGITSGIENTQLTPNPMSFDIPSSDRCVGFCFAVAFCDVRQLARLEQVSRELGWTEPEDFLSEFYSNPQLRTYVAP